MFYSMTVEAGHLCICQGLLNKTAWKWANFEWLCYQSSTNSEILYLRQL